MLKLPPSLTGAALLSASIAPSVALADTVYFDAIVDEPAFETGNCTSSTPPFVESLVQRFELNLTDAELADLRATRAAGGAATVYFRVSYEALGMGDAVGSFDGVLRGYTEPVGASSSLGRKYFLGRHPSVFPGAGSSLGPSRFSGWSTSFSTRVYGSPSFSVSLPAGMSVYNKFVLEFEGAAGVDCPLTPATADQGTGRLYLYDAAGTTTRLEW